MLFSILIFYNLQLVLWSITSPKSTTSTEGGNLRIMIGHRLRKAGELIIGHCIRNISRSLAQAESIGRVKKMSGCHRRA